MFGQKLLGPSCGCRSARTGCSHKKLPKKLQIPLTHVCHQSQARDTCCSPPKDVSRGVCLALLSSPVLAFSSPCSSFFPDALCSPSSAEPVSHRTCPLIFGGRPSFKIKLQKRFANFPWPPVVASLLAQMLSSHKMRRAKTACSHSKMRRGPERDAGVPWGGKGGTSQFTRWKIQSHVF